MRVRQVDLAKCFAIIGVLLIHASGEGLFYLGIGSRPWMQSLFWGSISRFAVPLFFLCSGALLLGDARKVTTRHVWTRSIPHMLAALFFWALLYRLVPVLRQGTMEKTELLRAISDVFCWRHEQHLYYLHILLLVYAALPVTRAFAAKADEKTVRYALALWGITGVFFPTLRALGLFSRIEGIPKQWALNLAWASIGCTVLGWFLRKHPMRVGASIGCFVSGFFLCFAGTALLSMKEGKLSLQLLEGLSPGAVLMAAGLFCLCGALAEKLPRWLQKIAETGGKASFCIYLVHQFALHAMKDVGITAQMGGPWWSVPVLRGVVCAVASSGCSQMADLAAQKGDFKMGFWIFMLAMDLIIPLSMVFLGRYFAGRAPGSINMLFGYRTARSMKNQDTWQFAHRYFGKLWYKMGLWLLILSVAAMLPGLGKDADAVGTLGGLICMVQLPVMLYAIWPTERALKKTFDKDGNRITP